MIENITNYCWYLMPNDSKVISVGDLSGTYEPHKFPDKTADGNEEVYNEYQPSEREIVECLSFQIDTDLENNSGTYLNFNSDPVDARLDPEYWTLKGIFNTDNKYDILHTQRRMYLKGKDYSYLSYPIFETYSNSYEIIGDDIVFDFSETFEFNGSNFQNSPYKTFINGEMVRGEFILGSKQIKISKNDIQLRNNNNYCKIIFWIFGSSSQVGEVELEDGTGFLLLEDNEGSEILLYEADYGKIEFRYSGYSYPIQKSSLLDGTLFEYFLNNNLRIELVDSISPSISKSQKIINSSFRTKKTYNLEDSTRTITFDQIIDDDLANIYDYCDEEFSIVGWDEENKSMIIFTRCELNSGISFSYNKEANSQSISADYLDMVILKHDKNFNVIKEVRM